MKDELIKQIAEIICECTMSAENCLYCGYYKEKSNTCTNPKLKKILDLISAAGYVPRMKKCPICRGEKFVDNDYGVQTCIYCDGTGEVPDYVQLAKDQSLPVVPEVDLRHDFTPFEWYKQAQQDMIKAGWKKVYCD